ncbi:hypothetical protein IE339_06525 [Priestia koreensis]|nr:hypothetical protein IE339_06525 [Priestia koreensis]
MLKKGWVDTVKAIRTIEEYLLYLEEKGFHLKEDARGFIAFGQQYAGASEEVVIYAIEWTLKMQREFDGSFFMSLVESLTAEKIQTRRQATMFFEQKGMI